MAASSFCLAGRVEVAGDAAGAFEMRQGRNQQIGQRSIVHGAHVDAVQRLQLLEVEAGGAPVDVVDVEPAIMSSIDMTSSSPWLQPRRAR